MEVQQTIGGKCKSQYARGIFEIIADEAEAIDVTDKLINSDVFKRFESLWTIAAGKNAKARKEMICLYEAFANQEGARYCNGISTKQKLLLKALDGYDGFISENLPNHEANYFAQWQTGLIKEALGMEWPAIEESLLRASIYYKDRGEAMKYVIQHYRLRGEYGMAYIYSSIAKDQYFDKVPTNMEWFGDPAFYQWKVLNYHLSICSHIGIEDEARYTQKLLWICYEQHPEYFSEEQLQQLFRNQKSFQQ